MMENFFCIFLEECKYVVNGKKIPNYIINSYPQTKYLNTKENIFMVAKSGK